MNPALIKSSSRSYRSRPHSISYNYFDQYPQSINSSKPCYFLVKSFSSMTQFISVYMISICPYF